MKRKIAEVTATALAVVMLCLSAASCGEISSVLKKYDSEGERYDYDLTEYITIPEYKNIEIPDLQYTPTEEKVAATRYKKLAYFADEYDVADGTVEQYDIVDCDYSCTVDGQAYSGLSSAGNSALRSVVVGIGEFDIPEIDEGIIGMAPGDTKTIPFTFPTPYYRDPLYSGLSGEFTVTIECIRRQVYEEYTDEFVSKYYGVDNTEAYDIEIETQLKSDYANYLENYEIEMTWDYVYSNSEMLKFPGKEYTEISDATVNNYKELASEAGLSLDGYVEEKLGYESLNAFYEDVDVYVRQTLKEEMILYIIARCENITVSDSEYKDALISYASEYETTDIDVCEQIAAKGYGSLDKFKEAVRLQKVCTFLGESAVKIDSDEYFEKKAAGAYVFDPDAARGMSATEILIIVVSCIAVILVAVIAVLAVQASKASKKRKKAIAEKAEREEIRRRRREEKQAKKKHHSNKKNDSVENDSDKS